MKKFLLLPFLFPLFLNAQSLKEFPVEQGEFFKVMSKFIEETNADQAEAIMAEFNIFWSTAQLELKAEEKMYQAANKLLKKRTDDGSLAREYVYSSATLKLNESQKKDIMRTCNTMLKKRMKAIPDFKNYIFAIISFQLSNQTQESFDGWQSSLDKLLEKSNKYYAAYINGCNNLFAGNLLYNSSSTNWSVSNSDYYFDFDSLPKIVFKGMTLICTAKKDSSVISDTKGTYYPTLQLWKGEGGKVNFSRAGFSEIEARAELLKYQIDISGADYSADSVKFYFEKYFKEPLWGTYTDKILANVTPENASYPRFDTYTKILQIPNIVPDVDYIGGFSLQGRKIVGTGNRIDPAILTFYWRNKPFLIAKSNSFVVRPERITSDRTAITVYLDTTVCNPHCDSMYHPSLQFKYIIAERSLALLRTPEGIGNSPFYDSFHKLSMEFEGMYWKIDEPVIDIRMITGSSESKASFESTSYYKDSKYREIQGLSDTHPFTTIKKYAINERSRYIYAPAYAKKHNLPSEQIRAMFMSLATKGFLVYNPTEDDFYVTDRVYFYLDAKINKSDYDVIHIESHAESRKSNAQINLQNFDLTINGVSAIQVSDSQSVTIFPKGKQIVMKANRDFLFSGRVNAGRFEYFGNNFDFNYDHFRINMEFVDSMRMKIPGKEKDEYGNIALAPVKSVIQYINGNLLIDDPGNKSGAKNFNEYPIFNSFKDSYVFYEKPSIQKGVYKKENFFFHLEPFAIDSINSFDPKGLGLEGTFVSNGIFPDFEETLKIQPDYSLGFVRPTPAEGFAMYGGKGTYLNTINMSNEGLRGDGVLNYVTSVSKSNNFIFFPDSMNALAESFEVKKQGKPIEFPPVTGQGVYEHWRPYKDKMHIYKRQFPLDFYDGQAFFEGSLELSPQQLTGNGIVSFVKAELKSDIIKFRETVFGADTSDFSLKSDEATSFAFQTINVKSEIDFVSRTGTFTSNGGASYVNFPVNQYVCFMDQFKWFMDDRMVELSMGSMQKAAAAANSDSSNINLEGSEFISTHPDQDSLKWIAPYAKFSIKDYVISAEDVRFMLVADAVFYPDGGKVTVRKKAKLDPFKNSKITANSTTRYHNITNVEGEILGKRKYVASGDYDYLDIYNKKQTIRFQEIKVDTTFQTFAKSTINDSVNFTLIPQISFQGDVLLNASLQFLTFSGYGKLNLECEKVSGSWFKFSSEINPAEVYIPLSDSIDNDYEERLTASVALFNDSLSYIYTGLLAEKRNPKDVEMLIPSGYLFYDKEANEFKISSREKLSNKTLPGNLLSFNDTKCTTYAEGKVNFGSELGQVKMITPGFIKNNSINYNSEIEVMMLLNFFFTDDALKEMAENIEKATTLIPADNNRPEYEMGLKEILGKEKSDRLITELSLFGSFKKVPDELLVPMLLSNVKFEWNEENRAFRSKGAISISNILKWQLNKTMQGLIEIQKIKTGDVLTIYLEADPSNWYFFRYTRGVMEAVSSNEKFNNSIKNLKSDKRSVKGDKITGSYEFLLSSDKKKSDFLRKSAPETKEEE